MTEPIYLNGRDVLFPVEDDVTQFYLHGYQSWSLTTWLDVDRTLPIPYPTIMHPLQYHPQTVLHHGKIGHWVGAVRTSDGNVHLLGSADTDCTVGWDGRALVGEYSGTLSENPEWFAASGSESDIFAGYAQFVRSKLTGSLVIPPQTIRAWCSWYSYYTAISEKNLAITIDQLAELPFDVIQIDDGWQRDIGDWIENDKFPAGLKQLADQIHSTSKQAGLWLAPLIASKSSTFFKQHPDWFIHDSNGGFVSAGFNWGQPLYGLDLTLPSAVTWLTETLKRVEDLGFTYLKLDFLYGGALNGARHLSLTGEEAYQHGLRQALAVLNPQTFVLFCGAPILPSIGLCHGLRIGPDVANFWESPRDAYLLANPAIPSVRNALRTCSQRLWLGRLVRLDPDVVYFATRHHSLSEEQAKFLIDLAEVCKFKATSDLPESLNAIEVEQLKRFLTTDLSPDSYQYLIDIQTDPALLQLPASPRGKNAVLREVLGWLANQPTVLKLLSYIDQQSLKKKFPQ